MIGSQGPAIVREAQPGDIEALAALHVTTFKQAHGRFWAPSYALRESQWRSAFAHGTDWFCYVAEAPNGELVGFAKGTLHDGGVPGYEGELNKIYVLRKWHRLGIGRALVEHVGRRFLSQGIHSMLLFRRRPESVERILRASGGGSTGFPQRRVSWRLWLARS
jgi:GNAT superfamily N-acetyltransferase